MGLILAQFISGFTLLARTTPQFGGNLLQFGIAGQKVGIVTQPPQIAL
jgi:hypothetical protein